VSGVLSMSFTVLAREAGFSVPQVLVTAVLCFAGAIQFAA
jgi:predicted branched-subunit amino acid permease